ncbi:MAG: type I methionyl aminopeptidase [Chloroflexi bacterium]|nr:MAG: type I methionyl aminopeptidase [Anaerolinea sp. 4484_236]RLD07267.1 MAG: type I methionyl aminopeptidase [Chloroflexota bacterium]
MDWARQIHVKNPAEIEIMREAGRINATVHATVRKLLKPGVTTADLNAAAEEVLRKHNATSPFKNYPGPYPFPASITVCINEELVHGIPKKKRKLKEGDLVSIDCGTLFGGFVADSAFSAGVGEVSSAVQKLLDVTENALAAGIDKMRPGNKTGDVSAAIQKYVESRGFYVTREYTGHGVGRQMHEGPQVPNYGTPGRGLLLRPGVTIALEPMVLIGTAKTKVLADQWTVISANRSLTAHFEHSIAVTEGEPLILTVL